MAGALQLFKNNVDREIEGVNLVYGDTKIKVARAGGANKRFSSALERESKPHRRAIELGVLDDEAARQMMIRVYSSTVILDWENMVDPVSGDSILFSYDNCVQVMSDYPDLFASVMEEAKRLSNFQTEAREADAKN